MISQCYSDDENADDENADDENENDDTDQQSDKVLTNSRGFACLRV